MIVTAPFSQVKISQLDMAAVFCFFSPFFGIEAHIHFRFSKSRIQSTIQDDVTNRSIDIASVVNRPIYPYWSVFQDQLIDEGLRQWSPID